MITGIQSGKLGEKNDGHRAEKKGLKMSFKRSWELALLAKEMAGLRFRRSSPNAVRARRHLVDRMGVMHGLPQKIGQILSLNELADDQGPYTRLTEFPEGLPPYEAFAEMEKRLGRPLMECFQSVEEKGVSASLAQVHQAVLRGGQQVAVKLQYPGIQKVLWTDLKALGWITSPVGGLNRGFDLDSYRKEVSRMIQEELNYENEARMIRSFGGLVMDWDWVEVPEVVADLSGKEIITMTWIEGDPFRSTLSWPESARRSLSEKLLRLFLNGCFRWGLLHSDPHSGNYRFSQKDGEVRIGLLDFGCVKVIDEKTKEALSGLIMDLILPEKKDLRKDVLDRYLDMGFKAELMIPMVNRLVPLSRVLFEPFLYEGPFEMKNWNLGERVSEILGPLRWNFRFAGPANLVLFMRAFQGMVQYLSALDVPVNWREALVSVLDKEGLKGGLMREGGEAEIESPMEVIGKGGSLRVRVTDGGEPKVDLTFRARAAGSLPDLIPEDLRPKLEHRAINLEEIARKAEETDFKPGELFRLEEGPKVIRVWLE